MASAWSDCALPGFADPDLDDDAPALLFRAGLALPVTAPPIPDAGLVARGDRIVALGPFDGLRAGHPEARLVAESPGGVLIPGLVNAHCHLSLTLADRVLPPTTDFVAWIHKLLALRRTWSESELRLSLREGLRETLRGGVTAVGDIVSDDVTWAALGEAAAPLRVRAFREFLGWTDAARAERAAELEAFLAGAEGGGPVAPGLSPHAPYSTHPALYAALLDAAAARGLPLATHGAETAIEAPFMLRGDGPFGDLQRQLGWIAGDELPWPGALGLPARLEAMLAGRRATLQFVHGTHLDDEGIAALARIGSTVAYCPGSTAFFHGGEDPHPVERLLAAGVPVALGTDSLASSPTLNLPLTCTLASRAHPGLAPATLLEMATLAGARSLGLPGGELAAGGPADFLVFDLLDGGGAAGLDPDDAVAGALLSGYRVPGLHVARGRPFAFASLRPFPAPMATPGP
jgi:cytosine/adenosine deaminase-related metal-dependent hydrolase